MQRKERMGRYGLKGERKTESYPPGIKSGTWETFDRLRVLCLHNNSGSSRAVLRWHAAVLIPPMNICNRGSAII